MSAAATSPELELPITSDDVTVEVFDNLGELAEVFALPSATEVPQAEEEILDHYLTSPDVRGLIGGARRTFSRLANIAILQSHLNSEALPRGVIIPQNGHNHRFLVTEPDPAKAADSTETKSMVFHPGLAELGDFGSALRLHVAYAERHRDQRVITKPTKDVSYSGHADHPAEGMRRMESMAVENLYALQSITEDGETELAGTSAGSKLATFMVEQNLAAEVLNVRQLTLLSSAVLACNIEEASENFRAINIDEEEYRAMMTGKFKGHLLPALLRLGRKHPVDFASCLPMVGAYALAPKKLPTRLKAIDDDFNNVKEGVDWNTLKYILAAGINIRALGGELDPLMIEQEPQWDKLKTLFPGQVQLRLVPNETHFMTADAKGTVKELDQMDFQQAA